MTQHPGARYPVVASILRMPVKADVKSYTRETLLYNFEARSRALARFEAKVRIESFYPNEHFSEQDVAFGYLKNHEFVVATDFLVPGVQVGFVAHIVMLVSLGYARDETDMHPKVDYLVRGIVKDALNRDVLFWETPKELLASPETFEGLQECLRNLVERGLTSTANNVYGSGTGATLSIGTVGQLLMA